MISSAAVLWAMLSGTALKKLYSMPTWRTGKIFAEIMVWF
jgi:hypothetical protein